jgi:hypothetical protein
MRQQRTARRADRAEEDKSRRSAGVESLSRSPQDLCLCLQLLREASSGTVSGTFR